MAHHQVNYRSFKDNPLSSHAISKYTKKVDEYDMGLYRITKRIHDKENKKYKHYFFVNIRHLVFD